MICPSKGCKDVERQHLRSDVAIILLVSDWWKLLTSCRSSLCSGHQLCQIKKKMWWHFRRRPRHYFNRDKIVLSLRTWNAPQSYSTKSMWPLSLKYLCQQLDKFLEGTCWNLSVPLVSGLRGGFCSKRCSKTVVESTVHNHVFLFKASLQLQKQTKQKKEMSLHEVITWLIRGAEFISSSDDWILTTNLIQAAGLHQLGSETVTCLDY